jgi:hypothetical protein
MNQGKSSGALAPLGAKVATLQPSSAKRAADLTVADHGSVMLVRSLTPAAQSWLQQHCPPDADHLYFGRALAVERRYIADLLHHAREAGLTAATH